MRERALEFALTVALLASGAVLAHDEDAITVMVGAGQDTTVVSAFFPSTIRVTVGDTVTFRLGTDEVHTVTFLSGGPRPRNDAVANDVPIINPTVAFPSRERGEAVETYDGTGFVHSGMMSHQPGGPDAPPNDHLTVTFTEPGTYEYHCLVHPWMTGTVVVEEDAATPSHAEVDERAQEEAAPLLALAESLPTQWPNVRSELGANGTTTWYVNAGVVDTATGDRRASNYDFLPEVLTVRAGDTVIWSSPEFHTVTFAPLPPGPEFITVQPQEQGPPLLLVAQEVIRPAKPLGVYDPTQFFNSGPIGPFSRGGAAWSLTFEEPGTYEYYCALHRGLGMEGTVNVLPR